MDQQHPQDAPDVPKKSFLKTALRPVSLLVVAFTLLGSLLMIEQTDTATTAPDAGLAAQPLDDSVAIAHRADHNRPARPVDVDGAVDAAHFAGLEVQAAIDRVQRQPVPPGRDAEACAFLLQVRAQFIVRIDILIDLVPASENRLLGIRARVLARVDAALLGLNCPISP